MRLMAAREDANGYRRGTIPMSLNNVKVPRHIHERRTMQRELNISFSSETEQQVLNTVQFMYLNGGVKVAERGRPSDTAHPPFRDFFLGWRVSNGRR